MTTAPRIGTAHLEKNLESFFYKRVRLLGGHTEKIIPVTKGVPDRLVLMPGGRIYLVELKSESQLSPAQIQWHRKAALRDVYVVTLTGRQQVLDWLRNVTADDEEDDD